jgi:hypothetical protein
MQQRHLHTYGITPVFTPNPLFDTTPVFTPNPLFDTTPVFTKMPKSSKRRFDKNASDTDFATFVENNNI